MKYAVLADIHGNALALEAVIVDAETQGAERFVCAGDIVGYGAEPLECVERLRGLDCILVAGNHDLAVADGTQLDVFNPEARDSVLWTRDQLGPEEIMFLGGLPLSAEIDGASVVHGSPHRPQEFNYILSPLDALRAFDGMNDLLCFIGHSHIVGIFELDGGLRCPRPDEFTPGDRAKAIVNVGSVGQPRDGDPQAAYALYDRGERRVRIRRVAYDWQAAAKQILAAGLPPMNAWRLGLGQ